jgi:hypothetical protein
VYTENKSVLKSNQIKSMALTISMRSKGRNEISRSDLASQPLTAATHLTPLGPSRPLRIEACMKVKAAEVEAASHPSGNHIVLRL